MNRRNVLQTLGAFPFLHARLHGQSTRPNILFLMTDEHRHDAVGYTNAAVKTPHLDALAKDGIAFTNAYSTSPSCVPARAAIYTGRYPSQCGAPTYITYLPSHETTFMSRLRAAGYHTAAIGKQHFGQSTVARGYDYEDLIDADGAERNDSYTRHLRSAGVKAAQLREPAGRFAFRWNGDPRLHLDSWIGERAVEYLRDKCPRGIPWFLTVSFHGPHQPFDGLGLPSDRQYKDVALPRPVATAADLAGKPPHFADIAGRSGNLSPQEIGAIRRAYYSKITWIDGKIGELIATLRGRGEYDNTLIVFTADHGDYMGDYGMVYKAQYVSESLMRIPMLVKPPVAGFQPRTEPAFVQNFDIAPTSLAAAGLPIPADMSARDLSPFWKDAGAARRTLCFLDAHGIQGVRDTRWKLVHYRDRDYGELYDLAADPHERRNLWDMPSAQPQKLRLRQELLNHLLAILPRSEAQWNKGAPSI
ncbi:MAG: sulfatase-like hydrolase/transferase [Bryobacterales bacterium]|nr:sulfatase-like hydrolase/transferase [Bryobacterales bacterium]